jgi:hypothetical protein
MSQSALEHYQTNDGHFKGGHHSVEVREWMSKPRDWTPEGKQALREARMSSPGGGYGNWQSYTTKSGEEVWLQSSYEMRVAKAFDQYRYEWERITTQVAIPWVDADGTEHMYYPDFSVRHEGIWYVVEVKGEHLMEMDDVQRKASAARDNGVFRKFGG